MKIIKNCLITLIISLYGLNLLYAQDSIPRYYANIEFAFTGQVENQFDSVFQVYYMLDLEDIRYRIEQVGLKGKNPVSSEVILQGLAEGYERSGSQIRMDVGLHSVLVPLEGLRYYDELGTGFKVILIAPFGELGDLEPVAEPYDSLQWVDPADSLYQEP